MNEEFYRRFVKAWWPYIKKNNIRTVSQFEEWLNKCEDISLLKDDTRRVTYTVYKEGLVDMKELQKYLNAFWIFFGGGQYKHILFGK